MLDSWDRYVFSCQQSMHLCVRVFVCVCGGGRRGYIFIVTLCIKIEDQVFLDWLSIGNGLVDWSRVGDWGSISCVDHFFGIMKTNDKVLNEPASTKLYFIQILGQDMLNFQKQGLQMFNLRVFFG